MSGRTVGEVEGVVGNVIPKVRSTDLPATVPDGARRARVRARWRGSKPARLYRTIIRWSAEHRYVLSGALSVVGIVGVALATHIIEQILGSAKQSSVPAAALGAALVLGIALLRLRDRVVHRRGTLFYVRLLQPWMSDLHDIAREARIRGQAEDKIIARWITPTAHPCVDDLTTEVAGIVAETERCLNDDTSQTGTHVAPNLMWPAAMAVGFQLPQLARGRVELIELLTTDRTSGRQRRPSESMDWYPADPAALPVHRRDRPQTLWLPAPARTVRTVLLVVELTGQGRLKMPAWPTDVVGRLTVYQHGQADEAVREKLGADPSADGRKRASILHGQDYRPVEVDDHLRVAISRAKTMNARALRARSNPTDGAGLPLLTQPDFEEELVVLAPRLAADMCWLSIREALHRYPEANVLLAMRVPKTIALAIGSDLAVRGKARNDPGCGAVWAEGTTACWQRSCMDPWSRLVPLMFDEGSRRYRLARVHSFQLPVEQLADQFGAEPAWSTS